MIRRLWELVVLDSLDSLKPPGFDLMVFIIATLGAILGSIQPATSSYILARIILGPTLFTVALYLALRSAAGVANLVSSGVMEVYLSYPLSRGSIVSVLVTSRIVLPTLLLLSIPLAVSTIILYPVVSRDPVALLIVFTGYFVQGVFYGIIFLLIALVSKSSGTASILGITFYFAYNILWMLLSTLASGIGSSLMKASIAMRYNEVMYYYAMEVTGLKPSFRPGVLCLSLVPIMTLASFILLLIYFTRRFEPS